MNRLPFACCMFILLLSLPAALCAQTWEWMIGTSEPSNHFRVNDVYRSGRIYFSGDSTSYITSTRLSDITSSSLIKFDTEGNVVCASSIPFGVNTGWRTLRSVYTLKDTTYLQYSIIDTTGSNLRAYRLTAMLDSGCNILQTDTLHKPYYLPEYHMGADGSYYFHGSANFGIDTIQLATNESVVGKLDAFGELMWYKKFQGKTHYTKATDGYLYVSASEGNYNSSIYKLDTNGNVISHFTFPDTIAAGSIAVDPSGNIYIAARITKAFQMNGINIQLHNYSGAVLLKLTPAFTLTKYWLIDSWQAKAFLSLNTDNNGNVFISGYYDWAEEEDTFKFADKTILASEHEHIFFLKIDSSGHVIWNERLTNLNGRDASLVNSTTTDRCGNVYYKIDIKKMNGNASGQSLKLGDMQIMNGSRISALIAKLNPDSLIYETEKSCNRIRLMNRSTRNAYTRFEWILPGDSIVAADELVFTTNPYHEKVSIGLKGYKPGGCTNVYYTVIDFTDFNPIDTLPPVELLTATVTEEQHILVRWKKQPLASSYRIYRYIAGDTPQPFAVSADTFITDTTARPGQNAYTYFAEAMDTCNRPAKKGNVATTILLREQRRSTEALTLAWTSYSDWRQGVDSYILYNTADSAGTAVNIGPQAMLQHTYHDWFAEGDGIKCYKVLAAEKEGNRERSVSNTLCVAVPPFLHIPNAFSPDNNSLNETFSVSHTGITTLHIEIYNRWGQHVFTADSPDFRWDGSFRGASAVEGVYYYRMEAYSYTGEKMFLNGTVQVVR